MMKNRENIEHWAAMTDEQLLSMAEASKAEVPQELSGKIDSMLKRLETKEQRKSKASSSHRARTYAFACIGLAAASVAAVLILHSPSPQPKDTFSSPEEAYAMLQSTFSHIASKTSAATVAIEGSMQHIEGTITEIYR